MKVYVESATALQTVFDYAGGQGVEVIIPSGTWLWEGTVPKIPPGLAGRLFIHGEVGATVLLTTSAPRFLDFGRTADYQTWSNIEISDLAIDVNNISMPSSNHVVLGMQVAGSETTGQRVNVENLAIRRIKVTNCPVSSTDLRRHIWIISRHLGAGEGTQTYLKDITVEDCELDGGSMGVVIAGTSAGATCDVFLDNIVVKNVKHDIGSDPSSFWGSSHVHIGSKGHGGSCLVDNLWGRGSRDVGIEINAMMHSNVRDSYISNSRGFYIVHANYNVPSKPGAQTLMVRGVHGDWSGGVHQADASSFFAAIEVNGNPLGSVTLRDCKMHKSSPEFTSDGTGIKIDGTMKRLLVDGFEYVEDAVLTDTSSVNPTTFYIDPEDNTPVAFRNVKVRIAGTRGGVGTIGLNVFGLYGQYQLEMENIDVSVDIVNGAGASAGIRCLNMGQVSGTVLSEGLIRRAKLAVANDSNPNGIRIYGTTPHTITRRLLIVDSDFSGLTANDVVFVTSNENKDKVFFRGNRWITNPKPNASVSVSASPFVYQNLDGYSEMVSVSGGTVSLIEIAEDGATYGTTGLTSGMFQLDNVSSIRVTYSSAPTMRKWPLK